MSVSSYTVHLSAILDHILFSNVSWHNGLSVLMCRKAVNQSINPASVQHCCAVPPQPPAIEGHQNGSVIKVSHRLASQSIVCVSSAAKPAATFSWLRNGVDLIAPGGSGDPSPGVVSIEYSKTTNTGHAKLEDSRSVLTIVPRDEDNEAFYSCLAGNMALQRPYQVTVQLNVQR